MLDTIVGIKRSHMCTDVTVEMEGNTVTLMGWVNKRRDLGQLIFITLRDRTGVIQTVIDEATAPADLYKKAESIRGEYVVAVTGKVRKRGANVNKDMKTGEIEIEINELRILSDAEVPPFQVADEGVREDLRLKYRYIDLRRPEIQNNLIVRHNTVQCIRRFFNAEGFLDIETPVLTKSTPEGARDYLVPSRVHQGSFYALPQSPQLFKQLLMISGFDKYYQITKCFRDEDLRADRQPEFTQVDVEMSFINIEDIMEVNERLMTSVFKEILNLDIPTPFQRMCYDEAMERFGVDKPDIRYAMELKNISSIVENSEFAVFQNALDNNGRVGAICVKDGNKFFSRKKIDKLVDFVKDYRAKGLAWINIDENGEFKSTISKFFSDEKIKEIITATDGQPNDLILICADKHDIVLDSLGNLRVEIAKQMEITTDSEFKFLWVTDFPLLEWDEEAERFSAKHHPFTMPKDDEIHLLETAPEKVHAKAYDLVLNGTEIAGGSLRIYQRDVQEKMFKALGFTPEQTIERFGFFLEAFKYGTPPHGGIAYGLDRLVMFLTGCNAIRDVIAFPKVKDASCPMTDAPSYVDEKQLDELALSIKAIEKEQQ